MKSLDTALIACNYASPHLKEVHLEIEPLSHTQENKSDHILHQANQEDIPCLDNSQIIKAPTVLESVKDFEIGHIINNQAMPFEINLTNITSHGVESTILNEHLNTTGEETRQDAIDPKQHYFFHPVDNIPIELDSYGPLLDTVFEVDSIA